MELSGQESHPQHTPPVHQALRFAYLSPRGGDEQTDNWWLFLKPQGAVGCFFETLWWEGCTSMGTAWFVCSSGHGGAAPQQLVLCPCQINNLLGKMQLFVCKNKRYLPKLLQLPQNALKPKEGTIWPISMLRASIPLCPACPFNARVQTFVPYHLWSDCNVFVSKPACQPFQIYHLLECFASIRTFRWPYFGSSVVFLQAEQIYLSATLVYFVLHTQAVQSCFWAPVCGCNLEPGQISAERTAHRRSSPSCTDSYSSCLSFCHQTADPGWLCCSFAVPLLFFPSRTCLPFHLCLVY